jgi:hypothetical protein
MFRAVDVQASPVRVVKAASVMYFWLVLIICAW